MEVPIKAIEGVELSAPEKGISKVTLTDPAAKLALPWDRFARLNAAAKALQQTGANTILDAGGYDGALV